MQCLIQFALSNAISDHLPFKAEILVNHLTAVMTGDTAIRDKLPEYVGMREAVHQLYFS